MMSDRYQTALASLRQEIEIGGSRPAIIDAALATLFVEKQGTYTRDLLLLLSDEAPYDDGMFSLIHAAESADDDAYVRDLLTVFSSMMKSSPQWASVVLMRALNNRATQAELVRQLRDASASVRADVGEMCRRINDASPQFLTKTMPVMVAAH